MGCTQKNAKRRNYVVDEDRLSQLPDEIIANILSRLPIKESGRTSVLSRRWEKLWLLTSRCSGRNLVFSCPIYNELYRRNCDYIKDPIVDRKRLLYIGLLNKVFKCHQQPLVDELVISLHLNSTFSSVIDEWLKFAFSKGVKRLELNLSYCSYLFKWGKPYAFPSPHNEYFRASGIHRLRVLCLKGVYINQEVVDALLSTFPLLESLSLQPKKLRDLKISCDKMLKLKHLEVFGPLSAKKRIQISAPYLVSLRYEGSMRALHLKCITRLSEFYVHDTDRHAFFMRINLHRSFISQLKKLKLFMCLQMFMRCTSYPLAFPELVKLEEMEVSITGCDGDSFLWPTVFIKASPLLHRFAIELKAYEEDDERCHSERDKRRLKESTRCRHKFLKVVEISKFRGMRSEMELAQHLFDIGAQSLEKVVIDTRTVFVTDEDAAEEVRKLARSAGQGLDSNVEFVMKESIIILSLP